MKPVPTSIKQLVQQELLAFSGKASEALRGGRFSLDDLIHSFLNGAVVKKERDETRRARYKYTITGSALDGCMVYSCGKIIDYEDGKRYFIITFHEEG